MSRIIFDMYKKKGAGAPFSKSVNSYGRYFKLISSADVIEEGNAMKLVSSEIISSILCVGIST